MTRPGGAGLGLACLLLLAACAAPVAQPVTWPVDATAGLADPGRQAILSTNYDFGRPSALAGRPAEAARAIAQAEFLAVDLEANPRWTAFQPRVAQGFRQARAEWRAAAGIAPDAPPQGVIDALMAARAALLAGNAGAAAAALPPPIFPQGGEAELRRLAALPPLPKTGRAASAAEAEMWRDAIQIDADQ